LASTPSPGFGTPTYKNPSPDTEEKKKHRELNRQRFEAEMERRRQEGEEERKQEDERRKQFDRDKQKALELLKSGSKSLGLKKDTGTGLKLKGVSAEAPTLKTDKYKEPPYTKGHKAFAPVDLRHISPNLPSVTTSDTLKLKSSREKGLKTSYVPKPSLPSLREYHYDKKPLNEIVLDALEVGRGDYMMSIGHLERYLGEVDPDNIKVQNALSYIQGMAEGDAGTREVSGVQQGPFDPDANDSEALTEAVSGNIHRKWPGPTVNPEQPISLTNPLDWKGARDRLIVEILASLNKETGDLNREDLQNCLASLQKKAIENPGVAGYNQALQFLKGLITHY